MLGPLVLAAAFIASYFLTGAMLAYCLRARMLDVPNARSSHSSPTPRGGGAAIVLSSLAAVAAGVLTGRVSHELGAAILTAGGLLAALGFWDDRRSLSPGLRFAAQMAAAAGLVYALGAPPSVDLFFLQLHSPYPAMLSALALVWLINLTNFMDGIDGLAAAECVFVLAMRGSLLFLSNDRSLAYACFALAAPAAGFLPFNWHPARIFMGDVGSGFIGAVCGALLLADTVQEPSHVWVWLILLAAFLTDSTVTLLHRLATGRRIWEAHRSHAYQRASRVWGHAPTTTAFLVINLLWLTPLAFCASKWPATGPLCFLLAAGPLVVAACYLGAGAEEQSIAHSRAPTHPAPRNPP